MPTKDTYITLVDGKTKTLNDANAKPSTVPGRIVGVHVQADGADVRYSTDGSAVNGSGTVGTARGLLLASGDDRYFEATVIQPKDLIFIMKAGGTGMLRITYFYESEIQA